MCVAYINCSHKFSPLQIVLVNLPCLTLGLCETSLTSVSHSDQAIQPWRLHVGPVTLPWWQWSVTTTLLLDPFALEWVCECIVSSHHHHEDKSLRNWWRIFMWAYKRVLLWSNWWKLSVKQQQIKKNSVYIWCVESLVTHNEFTSWSYQQIRTFNIYITCKINVTLHKNNLK